jgi:uncharacterized membrane protein YvbJ
MTEGKFFCEVCGREVLIEAEECPHCGRQFDSVKCPICGFSGKPYRFQDGCPKCGYMRKSDSGPSPARAGDKEREVYSKTPRWVITLAIGFLSLLLIVLVILYLSL